MAPQNEQQEADAYGEGFDISAEHFFFDPKPANQPTHYDYTEDLGLVTASGETLKNHISDGEYYKHVQSLNEKQREFFTHVIHWIKTKPEAIYCLLSGGAGVGKSVVIRVLYQALLRFFCGQHGQNPED